MINIIYSKYEVFPIEVDFLNSVLCICYIDSMNLLLNDISALYHHCKYGSLCHIDWAKDTTDTTSHSDWSDGIAMAVEYGVASLSEKENPLGDGSLSSDTDVSYTDFQRSMKNHI
jgi:hypothetical protein